MTPAFCALTLRRIFAKSILGLRLIPLKHELAADDLCLKEFFATEAVVCAVLMLFNSPGRIPARQWEARPDLNQEAKIGVQLGNSGFTFLRAAAGMFPPARKGRSGDHAATTGGNWLRFPMASNRLEIDQ